MYWSSPYVYFQGNAVVLYCSVFFRKAFLLNIPLYLTIWHPGLDPWMLSFPQQCTRFAIVSCIINIRKTCTVLKIRTWGVGRANVSKLAHAWKLVFNSCFMCYCCVRLTVNMCRNWICFILCFLFACPVCVTVAALVFQWNLILFPRERSKERIAYKCCSRCPLQHVLAFKNVSLDIHCVLCWRWLPPPHHLLHALTHTQHKNNTCLSFGWGALIAPCNQVAVALPPGFLHSSVSPFLAVSELSIFCFQIASSPSAAAVWCRAEVRFDPPLTDFPLWPIVEAYSDQQLAKKKCRLPHSFQRNQCVGAISSTRLWNGNDKQNVSLLQYTISKG